MEAPKVSWYLVNQDTYKTIEQECYAGNFNSDEETVEIKLELWNNRWGDTSVEDIPAESQLVIGFSTFEDSKMLELCRVRIDTYGAVAPDIIDNKGYIKLGKIISGAQNDGSEFNPNNFAIITIMFDIANTTLKDGLKSIYLDVEYIK